MSPARHTVADAEDAASSAAEFVTRRAVAAIERTGRFVWAVSGGSTPRHFLRALAGHDEIEWSAVHLFQVDERIATHGSEDRNDTMIRDALVRRRPAVHYHALPVDQVDLPAALDQHHRLLTDVAGNPPRLHLAQLGLGADGHTASLVPGDPVLHAASDLAITEPYQGTRRVTMTAELLGRAEHRLFLVTGPEKSDALARLLAEDPNVPATLLGHRETTIIGDRAAYGLSSPR